MTLISALDGGGIGNRDERERPALSTSTLETLADSRLAAGPPSRSSCPVRLLAVVPFPVRLRGASVFRRLFGATKPSEFSRPIVIFFP